MITSLKNERVKEWKKLQRRKTRYENGHFLIEGFHVVEEAWKSGWDIKEIILKSGTDIPGKWKTAAIIEVSNAVFKHISQTESPQGIIAVVSMKPYRQLTGNRIVVVDSIQDPGNLGTMIRTADAAGFHGVVLGEGTVDVYNEKVIRASQGSIFHIPIVQANVLTYITEMKAQGFQIVTSALKQSISYHKIKIPEKLALILGNEGSGIHEDVISRADINVHIPIYGEAESLNVSVAAGILMYHFS